jgi:DNA-directed RNA polymerase beta' subunit
MLSDNLNKIQVKLQKRYFCRICDVEYTYSIIRRTQVGYIQLASPTTHVWFVKGIPSYISILLDMKKKHLQNIIYNSETLTLEHSLRGHQFLPSSPSSIFESWQKIMQRQYPEKYGKNVESAINITTPQTSSGSPNNRETSKVSSSEQPSNNITATKISTFNLGVTDSRKASRAKKSDTPNISLSSARVSTESDGRRANVTDGQEPEPTKTLFLFGSHAGQSSGCHSALTFALGPSVTSSLQKIHVLNTTYTIRQPERCSGKQQKILYKQNQKLYYSKYIPKLKQSSSNSSHSAEWQSELCSAKNHRDQSAKTTLKRPQSTIGPQPAKLAPDSGASFAG